jgi:folate-binding protein YgfZ
MTVRAGDETRRLPEGYDDARTRAAVYDRGPRGLIALAGGDAVTFLHNILTNDIKTLAAGAAVYSADLTPQGRMITDMLVLRREHEVWLDVEPQVGAAVAERLDASVFAEDVRVHDRSAAVASVAVYGPEAWARVAPLVGLAGSPRLSALAHVTTGEGAGEIVALAVESLGVPGVHLFGAPERVTALRAGLVAAGVPVLTPGAYEALRIEAGTPLFGADMTTETIPLEAGIQDRAISMTKGCYVGQEVIIRILHRGHGRVARRLVQLLCHGHDVPASGATVVAGGAAVGQVTSSAFSPRLDRAVAFAYVPRDSAEPGTTVRFENGTAATVAVLSQARQGDPGG